MAGAEVSEPIFGKKFMNQLGGMANESAAAGVSDFARRQMEKMGWKEGKGLGKEEQGVVTHVKVKKREEFMGVGVEKLKVEEQKNQWWYNAYDKIADKIKIAPDTDDEDASASASGSSKKKAKKKASKKKRKRDAEAAARASANDGDNVAREKKFRIPTDEELFAATGGKLFGRRAYGSCNGKLKRDQLLQSGKFELKQSKKEKKKSSDEAKDSGANSTTSSSDDDEEKGAAEKKRKDKKKKQKKAKAAKKQAANNKTSDSDSDPE